MTSLRTLYRTLSNRCRVIAGGAACLLLLALAAYGPLPTGDKAKPHDRRVAEPRLALQDEAMTVGLHFTAAPSSREDVVLCQAWEPLPAGHLQAPYGQAPCKTGTCQMGDPCNPRIDGVDCAQGDGCGELHWRAWGPIPWQAFAQGEYVGPSRAPHVPEYRLRVDDVLEFVFVLTREEFGAYRIQVGDSLKLESQIDATLTREVSVLPDGTVTFPLIGQVKVSGLTIAEIKAAVEEKYKKYYNKEVLADFTITATKYNTRLEDLRAAVDSRFFSGGQGRTVRVNPEGTISLPRIGQVPAQGLSLDEIRREVNERYAQVVEGLEVTPNLSQRAPRFIFVVGEVRNPGRFNLEGPTTAMQAIALAGGWNNGGNLRQIVVFRRADDWRLLATKLDLRGALNATRPNPADEIWLRDSDVVVVPKSSIKRTDDIIELVFTNGIYRVFPLSFNYGLGQASTLTGS